MSPYADVAHLMKGRTIARIVYDAETIAGRVRELGAEIGAAYPEGDLLVLGLLKGSFIFLSDLVRQIPRPLQVDFLVATSYGNETVSLPYELATRKSTCSGRGTCRTRSLRKMKLPFSNPSTSRSPSG